MNLTMMTMKMMSTEPVMVEFAEKSSFSRLEADYRMTIRNLRKAFEMIVAESDPAIVKNIAETAISITKAVVK